MIRILANTWPFPPTRPHYPAVHKSCPYMVIVGPILNEDTLTPPLKFSDVGILFIYGGLTAGGPPRIWRGSTGRGCPEPVWDDQVTGASCWPGWGQLSAAAHLSPDKTDSYVRITYNIDRPTKYTLPLFNMTNLSSKWNVGWFCRLKKVCTVS